MASATSSATASSSDSSSSSPATNSLPMPAMIETANGEMRSQPHVADAALDRDQQVGEAADVGQARRGLGARRAQQHVVRVVLAQHVVDQVGAEGDLPAGLLLARDGAARSGPATTAQLRKVRLISELSAIHSSRSSPRMSTANSSATSSTGAGTPGGDAVVRGRRSPCGRRPRRSIRRVSSMPSVWCALRPAKQ